MAAPTLTYRRASFGVPCFAAEFKPVVIPQILQDELDAINAIYGHGTLDLVHAHNGRVMTQLRLPEIDLPPLRIAFPVKYPQEQPEILDFSLAQREKTHRIRTARLIILSVLDTQFIEGYECVFDLLETCQPILSFLNEKGLKIRQAALSLPGFIPEQWLWTTSENVNVQDIKATTTCTICLDEFYTFKMIGLPCKHHFCLECFQTGWKVSLQSVKPFTCCQRRIALEIIETNAMRTTEIKQYLRMLQEQDTDYPFYCGFASCNAVIGSPKECKLRAPTVLSRRVECPHCRESTCSKCRMPWHGGKCNTDTDLSELIDKDAFRRCPGCGYGIEKDGGCSHMLCTGCGTNFRWGPHGVSLDW